LLANILQRDLYTLHGSALCYKHTIANFKGSRALQKRCAPDSFWW